MNSGSICGLWIDEAGVAHVARATADGGRIESREEFRPFAWTAEEQPTAGVTFEHTIESPFSRAFTTDGASAALKEQRVLFSLASEG